MKILYSFNKKGVEEVFWKNEISKASTKTNEFIPFNHGAFINPQKYLRAQLLDNLFFEKNNELMTLYVEIEKKIKEEKIDAILVDNANPYHPDFLKKLNVFKILRTNDGPLVEYDRYLPYYHAFDMVLYHSPAYSPEANMKDHLDYCGVKNYHLWKFGVFEKMYSFEKNMEDVFSTKRDIDIIFVGALFPGKMPLLAKVKKEFSSGFILHGLGGWKKNLYFNVMYKFPGWVSPVNYNEYIPLYERSKIGINTHNRGVYTVGNYRLFDLPANGVMQISDGGEYLNEFFKVGEEIETYETTEELIDKIKYYLKNESARERIAKAGYNRVLCDHKIHKKFTEVFDLVKKEIEKRALRRF